MTRLLARAGRQRGIENGDRLTVDPDVNIYATDSEKGTTVVMRWGVDLPPVRALAASWGASGGELVWEAVPGSFVTGYQIEGAASADGPWARVDAPTETRARVEDPAVTYYRVATRTLTGAVGRPSPVAPVLHLAALAAWRAGDWERARTLARGALDVARSGAATADGGAIQALHWAGFVSAHEMKDDKDVLAWQGLVGDKVAPERGFEHALRLADTHQRLGDREAATARAGGRPRRSAPPSGGSSSTTRGSSVPGRARWRWARRCWPRRREPPSPRSSSGWCSRTCRIRGRPAPRS